MIQIYRKHNFRLLLIAIMTLIITSYAYSQKLELKTKEKAQQKEKIFNLGDSDVTALIASSGALSGNVQRDSRSANIVSNFKSPQDKVTWTVIAPKEDDYVVGVLFSKREQTRIEISSGNSLLTEPSMTPTWENRPYFWRQEMPGVLHLKAGKNLISLRLPDAKSATTLEKQGPRFGTGVTEEFHLFSIELATAAARKGQLERAQAMRGDTSWMVDGKYGLFVHFSAMSHALVGDAPRAEWFQKSIEMFDVKVFADAVERTGAAWVTFTATHQGFYWPGPNAALDKIAPGRTTKRDLLGEIINELDKRGIRTMLYLHTGYNGYDPEVWREAVGANDPNTKRFSDNIEAILRDCSLRYGKKLMGFGYIDGALSWDYPLNPSFEGWARAIKAGNPKAVVGFSSNRGTGVSPFSDLAVTDNASDIGQIDPQLIGPGRQLGDVTNAWWCLMDKEGWLSNKVMNGQFGLGPVHSTEEYVNFFKEMEVNKIPVTINMIMTADVTDEHPIFNPKCMEVMEEVRKAIRGK